MTPLHTVNRWYFYAALWSLAVIGAACVWPPFGSWSLEDQARRLDVTTHADSLARVRNAIDVRDLGLTPLVTAAHRGLHTAGERAYRIAFAVLAVATAWVMTGTGFPGAWLLLPLTYAALIPGEYALATLLIWPLLLLLTRERRPSRALLLFVALAAAPATALSPILIPVVVVLLFQTGARGWSREAVVAALAWGIVTAFLGVEFASHLPVIALPTAASLAANLRGLVSLDPVIPLSALLLALWCGGTLLLNGRHRTRRVAGATLLALGALILLWRTWFTPDAQAMPQPQVSLLVLAPWLLLLALPPYRRRPQAIAFLLAVGFAVCALRPAEDPLALPVAIATALPLALIDLKKSGRDRGPAFVGLVLLTALNTVSFAVLVGDRAVATASHVRLLEPSTGTPLVISPPRLGFEVAPMWRQREIYGAHDQRDLLAAALEFRHTGVDTFYLLLDARDPLYVQTFPAGKPAWPNQMTITNGGTLRPTQRRLYKLVTNPTDSLWRQWDAESMTK